MSTGPKVPEWPDASPRGRRGEGLRTGVTQATHRSDVTMQTWTIGIEQTVFGTMEVEAATRDDAEREALEVARAGGFDDGQCPPEYVVVELSE